MLKLDDLALRPDLQIGPMLVSPSRRLVEGPGGSAHLEPLVMQVFLLLVDRGGKVVTRNDLFDRCWGGVMVGDASLNRTIVKIRSAGARAAPGLFEVETIPRTGYRMTGKILGHLWDRADTSSSGEVPVPGTSRRMVLGGVVAAVVVGGGSWWASRDRTDPQFAALVAKGKRSLVDGWPGTERDAVATFRKAIALQPNNAEAWGLLAYAQVNASLTDVTAQAGAAAQAAERSVTSALAIDPKEPNALLAMIALQRGMRDRAANEDELRKVLAIAPDNALVVHTLAQLLHSTGRLRESYAFKARAVAIEPLSPDFRARQALGLWALGRTTPADQLSDRTMQLWPSHRLVRSTRLLIYAFTDRTGAAMAMVEDEELNPGLLSGAEASVWRVSLEALEKRTRSTIAAARTAIIEASKTTAATASHAILILSGLGEVDAAFDVANGFLLARGSVLVRPKVADDTRYVNMPGWRNTFGLFMPPTKPMRLDPRFRRLCDELGLTTYWRKREVGPDDFLFKA
jgi:DNA-binding winged helix-turn-helix (wHTH) protein/Tfp pilus assembly protein PilF